MSDQARAILCPYCGDEQPTQDRCRACGGYFDDLSRRATQQHMGPWFIRDADAPFRPGCSFAVLLKQIQRGKITRETILRGPTTKQYWTLARQTPGVAHHLGTCHACGGRVLAADAQCPSCGARFPKVTERNQLGLDVVDASAADEATPPSPRRMAETAPSVARARVVATTALGPAAEASPAASPSGRNTVEWLTGDSASRSQVAAAPHADDRFAAAMALPQPAPPPEDAPPVAAGGGTRVSPLVWAAVALNVLLLIAAVGFIFLKDSFTAADPLADQPQAITEPASQAPPPPGPATEPSPAPPASSTGPAASWPESKSLSLPGASERPPDPPPLPGTAPGSPKPPPVGVLGGDPVTATSTRMPIPVPLPAPKANAPAESAAANAIPSAASFFGIPTGEASGVTAEQIEQLNKTMREVDALYRGGMIAEALARLKQLKANLPAGVRSDGLDNTIAKVEKELAEKETREFFEK